MSDWETERFIPVASAEYHFRKSPRNLPDLFRERLLIREQGSGSREILEKNLVAANYSLEDFSEQTEVNSIYAILQLLAENLGISFLYEPAARKGIRSGEFIEIPLRDFSVKHDFCFIWDKNSIFAEEYRKISGELKTARISG